MSCGGLVICLAWKTTVYLRTYPTVTGAKPFGWYNMWRGSFWAPKVERNIDKGNKNRRRFKLTGCLLKHCRHQKSFSSNLDEAGPHDYICTLSNRDWQHRIAIFLCVALIDSLVYRDIATNFICEAKGKKEMPQKLGNEVLLWISR